MGGYEFDPIGIEKCVSDAHHSAPTRDPYPVQNFHLRKVTLLKWAAESELSIELVNFDLMRIVCDNRPVTCANHCHDDYLAFLIS